MPAKTSKSKPSKAVKSPVRVSPSRARKVKSTAPAEAVPRADAADLSALRTELASLRTAVEKSLSPIASCSMDEIDAVRRVLSYLFEARTESILRELVTIYHAAATLPDGRKVTEPLEALLTDLGAIKFTAERLEHVDPLIHAIARETQDQAAADAVVMETLRPGFRTGRGVVIARALVVVNRRS